MDNNKTQKQAVLGTLVNEDASGIIAYSDQIYDKKEEKSIEDIGADHEDRVKKLETWDANLQTSIENITKTGEASAASNVTYDHTSSKLDASNVQQVVDEVYKKSNYNDGEEIVDFNSVHLIEDNPEFAVALVDADGRVLAGIRRDSGSPYYGVGIPEQVREYIDSVAQSASEEAARAEKSEAQLQDGISDTYKKSNPNDEEGNVVDTNSIVSFEDNPEYMDILTDADGKLLESIGLDGVKKFHAGIDIQGVGQNAEESLEFMDAKVDNEGRLLESTGTDGSKTFYGDVKVEGSIDNEAISKIGDKVDKEDGKGLIDEEVASLLSIEDSPEYTAVNIDNGGKVIDSMDAEGVVTHNTKHIFNGGAEIKDASLANATIDADSASNIAEALKSNGKVVSMTDWSDRDSLEIEIPRCAMVNITSSDGTAALWPAKKTDDKKYWMQFWDMRGNYFKKRIIFNAQGNSSLGMPKKNGAIDLCNDEWEGDDTFSIKFGDWVEQDSFHLKSYYADYFIGVAAVGYDLFKDIINTRDIYNNRDWKRYQLPDLDTVGVDSQALADFDDNHSLTDDATCFPQGFPCIVYLDGEFYGVYSWQIKKHRDNYQMKKANYSQIHLDGLLEGESIFNLDGTLDWGIITGTKGDSQGNKDGFEIRNPKKLICIDGKKYDADDHNVEIIGEDSDNYDSTDKDMVNTAKVKSALVTLSTYIPTLQGMADGGSTYDEIKAKVAEYFDTTSLIDFCIFGDITCNADGYRKNWQWLTYDGKKWIVEPYDLDSIFGWSSWSDIKPTVGQYGGELTIPSGWVIRYWQLELQKRYKELRDNGIIDADYITGKLKDWIERVGSGNYDKDHEKWPYNKAMYSSAGSAYANVTRKDSIYRFYNWVTQRIAQCDMIYYQATFKVVDTDSSDAHKLSITAKTPINLHVVDGDGYFLDSNDNNLGKNTIVSKGDIYCTKDTTVQIELYPITSFTVNQGFDVDINIFKYAKNIRNIVSYYGSIYGDISCLADRDITNLNISSNRLTGDIGSLYNLKNIYTLYLSQTKVYGDISVLSNMIHCSYLSLANTQVTGDASVLGNLTNLIMLNMGDTNISNFTVDLFKDYTIIKEITVPGLTGDLSSLKATPDFIYLRDTVYKTHPTNVTWTKGARTNTTLICFPATEVYLDFGDDLDNMLIDQATCELSASVQEGYKKIAVKGNRTSASDEALEIIQNKGVTVTIRTN